MKKTELVAAVAAKLQITKTEASRKIKEVDAVIEAAIGALEAEDKVKIGEYVAVEKKEVPARICRNPKTGEEIEKAAYVATKIKHTSVVKKLR